VANVAKTVLVLDHHETGERISKEVTIPNVQFHMDMTKSGALLAYEWVNGSDAAIPEFLRLIDDHDRGVWQYEETRPFMEYLKIQPYDFGVYAELCSEQVVDEYTSAGRILVQGQTARVQQALSYVGKGVTSGMHYVILNANVDLTQHGQAMLQAHPEADMSVVWYLDYATGLYVFSFRSTKEHVNVAAYAKQFKGGGHKHAAGCRGDPSSAVVKIFL
jgi:oligoribonuclease NrnB/cAMP/cGMP phosphodiesterase (DHH superfamily)